MKRLILFLCFLFTTGCGHKPATSEWAVKPGEGLRITPATADQILQAIQHTRANTTIVNVWATWCQPCVEEFPDIMKVYEKYKGQGVRVVFISADFENPPHDAEAFLKKQGVDFVTFLKSGKDMAFINTLDPNWSGALPATWIYNAQGQKQHFWEGKVSLEQFEKTVRETLGKRDS